MIKWVNIIIMGKYIKEMILEYSTCSIYEDKNNAIVLFFMTGIVLHKSIKLGRKYRNER